jgi:hypothetical protein
MLSKVDELCAERDRLVGESRRKYDGKDKLILGPRIRIGAVRDVVGIRSGVISNIVKLSDYAARSIGSPMGFVASVFQPSTLRMLIWPEASARQRISRSDRVKTS